MRPKMTRLRWFGADGKEVVASRDLRSRGVRVLYGTLAPSYERMHSRPRHEGENALVGAAVGRALRAAVGPVIDLGCGTGLGAGLVLAHADGWKPLYLGVDFSGPMLAAAGLLYARHSPRVAFLEWDLCRTPWEFLKTASRAVALSLYGSLCYVQNPAAVLAEIRRVLAPGGAGVIMVYGRRRPAQRTYTLHNAVHHGFPPPDTYTAAELTALLTSTGFVVDSLWGMAYLTEWLPDRLDPRAARAWCRLERATAGRAWPSAGAYLVAEIRRP